MHCAFCVLIYLILKYPYEVGTIIIIPILQMRKLRLREIEILQKLRTEPRFNHKSLGFSAFPPIK